MSDYFAIIISVGSHTLEKRVKLTGTILKSETKPFRRHNLPRPQLNLGPWSAEASRAGAAVLGGTHILNVPVFVLLVQQSKEKASSCRVIRGRRRGVGQVQQAAVVALPCHL